MTQIRTDAATSDTLNFQAKLMTSAGAIAADGNYNVEFNLYSAASGGSSLWSEDHLNSTSTAVRVANGYLTVNLGSVNAFPSNINWDQNLYLGMTVRGTASCAFAACTPADSEMTPRLKLTATPFAMSAGNLANVNGSVRSGLTFQGGTVSDQNFVIPDQGAAGTYNILTAASGTDGYIKLQGSSPGTQQTGHFNISGSGIAGTSLQAPLFQTGDVSANSTNSGNLVIRSGNATGTASNSGNITIDVGTATGTKGTINLGTTNAAAVNIGNSSSTITINGPLTANGPLFTNNGATLLTATTLSNFTSNSNIGTAAATVDVYTTFKIPQTTAGITLTLPAPTDGVSGHIVYVVNTGTQPFTMHGVSVTNGHAQTYVYNGSTWTPTNIDGAGNGVTFVGTIDSQTKSADGAVISGNGVYLQTADSTHVGLISTTTQTFGGDKNFGGSITVNSGKSLTIVGGNTASRPASPTAGMLYYDSSTNQLIQYNGSKWISAPRTATKIVAANNSSQEEKDAADYVATGSSAQNTINTAIAALPSGGGSVYLTEGTYIVDGSVNVTDHVALMGSGTATLLKVANGANNLDAVINNADWTNGNDGIRISNLAIDGNSANATNGYGIDAESDGTSQKRFQIDHVDIRNFGRDSIYLSGWKSGSITDSYFAGNGFAGIDTRGNVGITISDNHFDNNSYGVFVADASGVGQANIANNTFTNGTNVDLYISSSNVTATNNVFTNSAFQPIILQSGSNNIVSNNLINSPGDVAIIVEGASQSQIINNQIYNSGYDGIDLSIGDDNLVSNNYLYNVPASVAGSSILVETNNNRIVNNTIESTNANSTAIGIINGVLNNYLSGNIINTTGTAISDSGSGTQYVNQANAANGSQITFRTANDTAAFQIQNASGTALMTADTVNSQLILRGATDNAVVGSPDVDTAGGVDDFPTWPAATDWTLNANSATHTAGNTAALVDNNFFPTNGKTYQVSFTYTACTSNDYVQITFASNTLESTAVCNGTNTVVVKATGNAPLRFTPTGGYTGTISNVVIEEITTPVSPVVTVKDASNQTSLEVRAYGGSVNGNIFIGADSGSNNSGYLNIALGGSALQHNSTGTENTAIGGGALQGNSTGSSNTAIGVVSLNANTTGSANTALGENSLYSNTTGSGNAAIGFSAQAANTTGSNNTAQGNYSLRNNTTGSYNSAFGYYAGFQDAAGTFNTSSTVQNATTIGAYAQVQASNTIVLGSVDNPTQVVVGSTVPVSTNSFGVSPVDLNSATITADQTVNTITASSAIFSSANVGEQLVWDDGSTETITGFTSTTVVTGSASLTKTSQHFRTHHIGFQVTNTGDAYIRNGSTAAFQIQGATGTALFNADTTNSIVTFQAGRDSSLASNGTAGSELITNGDFTTADWTTSDTANWAMTSTTAHYSGSNDNLVSNQFTPVIGDYYRFSFTYVTNNGDDCVDVSVGDTWDDNDYCASGTHVGYLKATGTDGIDFAVYPDSQPNADLVISNVSVKRMTYNANPDPAIIVKNSDGSVNFEIRTTGDNSVAIGKNAGSKVLINSVALGSGALQNNVLGAENVAIGPSALQSNTDGTDNVAIGITALQGNTIGTDNTGIGAFALQSNSTGSVNTALGSGALNSNTTGWANTGIGFNALSYNTTGSDNVGLGYGANHRNTTGNGNIAVGAYTLYRNLTGSYNTALGYNAGGSDFNQAFSSNGNLQNATSIGAYAQVQANNTIVLGSVDNPTQVVIGATVPVGGNSFGVSPVDLNSSAILASQGSGSPEIVAQSNIFSASNVGEELVWDDGTTETIIAYTDPTHVTGSSDTITEGNRYFRTHHIGFQVTNTGDAYIRNGSTNAFQVQNATGSNVLNVDTANSTVTLQSSQDSGPVLGPELLTNTDYTTADWTTSDTANWTLTSTDATYVGGFDSLVSNQFSATVGDYYMYSYTISNDSDASCVDTRVGNADLDYQNCADGTYTGIVKAVTTDGITLTVLPRYSGLTLSNISVKHASFAPNTAPVFVVKNSAGNVNLELRAAMDGSIAIGKNAGKVNLTNSIAIGEGALENNTAGWRNIAVGGSALQGNTTGRENAAFGYAALQANTTGAYNTAVGNFALTANTWGNYNTANGWDALQGNTSGGGNSAYGVSALGSNSTGNNNTAIGNSSLGFNTTGSDNVAIGSSALNANSSGSGNVAIGIYSGANNSTGDHNISIGYNAGYQDNTGQFQTTDGLQNATAIGAYAQVQASNSIVLGSVDIATKVGIGTTVPTNTFSVSPLDYKLGGVIRTNGSAVLDSAFGSTWTSAMVGDIIIFEDGTTNTVAGFIDSTHITMGTTYTGATDSSSVSYRFHHVGLQVTSAGNTYVRNGSTTAFQIQGATGTALFTADTTNNAISLNGNVIVANTGSLATKAASDFTTTGTTTDANLGTASLVRLNGASAQTINGISGGTDGRILTIVNAGANAATITNNSGSAGNKVITGTGTDLTLLSGASITLIYDSAGNVWRVTGSTSSASGGSFVQLQGSTPGSAQTGNFNISGTGIADTLQGSSHVYAPDLDVASAGTLSIGVNTATAISIGKSGVTTTIQGPLTSNGLITGNAGITVSGGAVSLTANAASNIATTSGVLTLQGAGGVSVVTTNVAAGSNGVVIATGNASAGTAGSVQIDTGTSSSGTSQINIGISNAGSINIGNGTNTIYANSSIVLANGNNITFGTSGNFDQSASSGTFKTGSGAVTLNGATTASAGLTVTNAGALATKAAADFTTTGTTTDANLGTASLVRLNGATAQTIDGISGGTDGRILTIVNAGANTATITNNSGSAGKKVITGTGGNINLVTGASITLIYDATDTVWRVTGATSATGGYIQLQGSTPGTAQTGNFNISGTGIAGTLQGGNHVYTPDLDVASAGTLSIGVNTATAISIGKSGVTTTINGPTTSAGLITGQAGITTSGGAVSLTGNAASSLTTTTGLLTLQGAGGVSISTTNVAAGSSAITLQTGNASAGTAGNITIDTGTSSSGTSHIYIGNTNAGDITIGNGTNTINASSSITVAAGKTIRIIGDTTGNRPSSPSAGTLFYDTTTNQLIQYNGSKWVSDRTNAIIVAANNSTQAEKDAADYVATGTGDQATINSALSDADPAGSGKKVGQVLLLGGTYNLSAAVSVPNNVTLAGTGAATILAVPNAQNGTYNMITNTDTTTGTKITIRDLQIDGNKANQTSGTMTGIYLSGMGAGTGSSARSGAKVVNVTIRSLFSGFGIILDNASNNTITGNTLLANATTGIVLQNSSNNNTITGNTTQGNGNYGFYLDGSSNNTFTGNTSQGNGNGVRVDNSSNNNTFSANTFQGNTNFGIDIRGASNGNTVTGNTSQGNSFYGITVSSAYNAITSNTFQGNGTLGIYLNSGSNNDVTGNKIHDNGGNTTNNGIKLTSASSNSISNNDITDTSCSTNCYAINISDAASANNYLANNNYSGSAANNASINDVGTGTIYANQADSSGNLINKSAGGGFTIGASSASASLTLQGGLVSSQLPAPTLSATVTNVGTAGGTTYRYQITALDGTGETTGSSVQQTTTGNATLSGTNYNTITWTAVGGAYQYKIYRCTGGACTPALLTTVAGNTTSYNDQAAGSPSGAVPSSNTTGGGTFAGVLQSATHLYAPDIDAASAGTLSVGVNTATAISIGKVGVTTTINGPLTSTGLITGNAGITTSGGAVSLTGNAASSLTTTTGLLTLQGAGGVSISSTNVAAGSSSISIQTGNASAGTAGNLTIDTGSSSSGTSHIYIGNTNAGDITIGNGTNTITASSSIAVAAGKSIRIIGAATGSRPSSPSAGTLFYDTTTNQLIQYNGTKWVSDARTATKIVAASNSSQAEKDAADYVATGTSDQNTINSAITALPSGGGALYLMEGTFTVDSNVNVPSNVQILGAGPSTILKVKNGANASNYIFMNSDTTNGNVNIHITNMTIDGNSANNSPAFGGIEFTGTLVQTVTVENVIFQNLSVGISAQGFDSLYQGNKFYHAGTAMDFENGGGYNRILSNYFEGNSGNDMHILTDDHDVISNNASYQSTNGYFLEDTSYTIFTNNTSTNDGGKAIDLEGGSNDSISNNVVTGSSSTAITVGGSGNDLVSNNTVTNSGSTAIAVYVGSSVVSNNLLTNNGGAGAASTIEVASGSSSTIADNTITDTAGTGYAIKVDAGVSGTTLRGNTYSGTGATNINDAGTNTLFTGQFTSTGSTYSIQAASAVAINATGNSNFTTSTGTLTLQGSGAVTVGTANGTTTSAITIQTGNASSGASGNITIDTGTSSSGTPTVNIGSTNARAVQIGNTTNATSISIDAASSSTVAIANSANTHTVSIATGAAVQGVTIGSTNSTSTLTLQGGNGASAVSVITGAGGGISIQTGNNGSGTAGAVTIDAGTSTSGTSNVNIGTTNAGAINLGNTTTNILTTINGQVLIKPTTGHDSTTAFRIQNAGGGALMTADTTTNKITFTGGTDSASKGSQLITSQDFTNATYWTNCNGGAGGWSGTATNTTHNSGNTVACVATSSNITVTAGTTYLVEFQITGNTSLANTITPKIGGVNGKAVSSIGTDTEDVIIKASTTGALTFTPFSGFNGTISNVSVWPITLNNNPAIQINNSSNTPILDIRSTIDNSDLYIGRNAGQTDTGWGGYNTGIGGGALQNIALGGANTAVGYNSLSSNANGNNNVAFGDSTLSNNIASQNTAVGSGALTANTSAGDNTAVGYRSLNNNTVGTANTALGSGTLTTNINGSSNLAIGYQALQNATTSNNVALGYNALNSTTSGSNNTAIGYQSGYKDPNVATFTQGGSLQNATTIGYGAIAQASNTLILGGVGSTSSNLTPNVGIGTTSPTNLFSISPNIYDTGTICQGANSSCNSSGTAIFGTGTTFTSSMVGMELVWADGTKDTITGYVSATQLTIGTSRTKASSAYRIHNPAFYVTSTGSVESRTSTNSTTALQVQNASGSSVFSIDTTNAQILTNTIDTLSGTTLNIGGSVASAVAIGSTSNTTTVKGNLTAGNAAGTGTFTNNGATVNTATTVSVSASGAIGTAAATVDAYTYISVTATNPSLALTMPTPTASTTYGRIVYVSNIGINNFTLNNRQLNTTGSVTLIWVNQNGGASWHFAGGSAIDNQNNAAQTANFIITGTGRADTGLQAPSLERASSGTLSLGTTSNTTAITLGSTNLTGNLNIDSGASSTISIGSSASARTITIGNVAAVQAITVGSTNSTSTSILQGGTGVTAVSVTTGAGGGISIQSGNNGAGTAGTVTIDTGTSNSGTSQINIGTTNAGAIAIGTTSNTTTVKGNLTAGNAAGTGTFTNNGSTVNSTLAISNSSGVFGTGTAAGTVDIYTSFSISAGTTGLTYNPPTPTASTTYGRVIYVANIGSNTFTLGAYPLKPGATATLIWANTSGGASWQYAGADGASILNQTSQQTSANFNIDGTGIAATLKASTFDTNSNVTLSIGNGNASAINIGNTSSNIATTISGTTLLKTAAANSTTAFQVQNSIGGSAFTVDTTSLNTNIDSGNGSFEGTVGSGWALKAGSGTVARDTTQAYSGTASLKTALTSTAIGDGLKYTFASSQSASTYTLQFWILQTAGTAFGSNLQVGYNNGSDNNCTLSPTLTAQAVSTTGWVRYTCTVTTTGTTTFIYWKEADAPASARTFFLDGVQWEQASTAKAFKNSGIQINGVIGSPVALQNTSDSTTAFTIQNSSNTTLLAADTLNSVIKIGATGAAQQSSNSLIAMNTEVQGAIYIGNSTGNISTASAGSPLRYNGTARNTRTITLTPEYPGAVMTGDGTTNIGTMTSDFCADKTTSPTFIYNVASNNCNSGDIHNYYSWTAQATNDYDILVRYQVPDDFSAFSDSSGNAADTSHRSIKMYGWRTASTDHVYLSLYNSSGVLCGTGTTDTSTSNLAWTQTNYASGSDNENSCSITAGNTITFDIHMVVGTNNDYARAGEISFNYLSAF